MTAGQKKPPTRAGAEGSRSIKGDGLPEFTTPPETFQITARAWLFHCPACELVYESPVEVLEASHRCPARGGAVRRLREGVLPE